jgi:hypothetical protein
MLRSPRHKRDRGTKMVYGKPHHWMEDEAGKLHIFSGPAPGDAPRILAEATADLVNGDESLGGLLDRLGVPK